MTLSPSTKQPEGLRHSLARRFISGFLIIIAVVVLCPILFCGATLGAALLSEPLARSMMPPTYPNSQFVAKDKATGSWGYTEFYYYETSDSVATVDTWYQNNTSNFSRTVTSNGSISLDNTAADSLLAHVVGWLNKADWGSGPSAGLTIYPDPKQPGLTQITIVIAWPSL